jgi:hypothetical protein
MTIAIQHRQNTEFETLPVSGAVGSANKGRLTNPKTLDVDTSWYFRYRSTQNPDLGVTFPQLLNIANQPAMPLEQQLGQFHDTGNRQRCIDSFRFHRAGRIWPARRKTSSAAHANPTCQFRPLAAGVDFTTRCGLPPRLSEPHCRESLQRAYGYVLRIIR